MTKPSRKPATPSSPRIQWTAAEDWLNIVDGPGAPVWFHLDDDERFRLVKSNPVRRVWQGAIGERHVFVKEFDRGGFGCVVRRRARGSEAQAEWRIAQAAAKLGVPTVQCVACGESGGRSFLVSIEIPAVQTLQEAWKQADAIARRRLLVAAARLLALAHDRGFLHGDEHGANLLVHADSAGAVEALYADVARGHVVSKVSHRQAAHSLAQLNQWFRRRMPRFHRLRFLTTYCRLRSSGDRRQGRTLCGAIAPLVYAATHEQEKALWSKRDSRIFATNRYFAVIERPGHGTAHVILRFRQRDLFPSPSIEDMSVEDWQESLAGAGSRVDLEVRTSSDAIQLRSWFERACRLRHRDLPSRWPFALVLPGTRQSAELWVDRLPQTRPLARPSRRSVDSLADLVALMADRGATFQRVDTGTLGLDAATDSILIEDPLAIDLHERHYELDLVNNCLAILRAAVAGETLRRTDAARLLKRIAPNHWKSRWKQIAAAAREV